MVHKAGTAVISSGEPDVQYAINIACNPSKKLHIMGRGASATICVEIGRIEPDAPEKGELESLSTMVSDSELKLLAHNQLYYDLPRYYRWVILIAFAVMSGFTGATFMNWPPLHQMFHWANAYSHVCDPSNPTYEARAHGEIYCDEKERLISSILPASACAMYAFDIVAGVLLDCIGGKLCILFGLLCQITGWILIGISAFYSINAYLPGMIVIAIGVDPSFYGTRSVC